MPSSLNFSNLFRFSDWPNPEIPRIAAGVYAIWDETRLIYCGMSGRQIESIIKDDKKVFGLITRLASHRSGRLSGDQFCVYVANRLVIPNLSADDLKKFSTGGLTLDRLTKQYINNHFTYQFAVVTNRRQPDAILSHPQSFWRLHRDHFQNMPQLEKSSRTKRIPSLEYRRTRGA